MDFLSKIEHPKNIIQDGHKTFSLDIYGNMLITYREIDGRLMHYERKRDKTSVIGASDTTKFLYVRKRLANIEDGQKYRGEAGQKRRLFYNGLISYNLLNSSYLVLTEGEKKAWVGCANSIPCAGLQGITASLNVNKDAAGQKDPVLLEDFEDVVKAMPNLKTIILQFDADCRGGSTSRKVSFASAVINFQEAIQKTGKAAIFCHIKDGLSKGLDDLLFDQPDAWAEIADDLFEQNLKSEYFSFIRLPAKTKVINSYFHNALTEDDEHPELLENVQRAYFGGQVEESELVSKLFSESYIFNQTRKTWMAYVKGHWSIYESDSASLPIYVARKLKSLYIKHKEYLCSVPDTVHDPAKAVEKAEKAFTGRILKLSSTAYLSGIVSLMAGILSKDEKDFDVCNYTLNCQNGQVDLLTGELSEHDPKGLHSKQANVLFNPAKREALNFFNFLEFAFDGDAETLDFIQKWAGLCLSGLSDWQGFVYAYGNGKNGKTGIANAMQALLGTYSTVIDIDLILQKRGANANQSDDYKIAELRGARFVVGTEIPQGQPMHESRVKSLTGGDEIAARPIRGTPIKFKPQAKYFFFGNYKLSVKGQDDGIWRRIYMLDFNNKIPDDARLSDTEIQDIYKSEGSAILNWAIEGFQKFIAEGRDIKKPKRMAKVVEQYKQESDILAEWMGERLGSIPETSKAEPLYLDDAFKDYVQYCKDGEEDRAFKRKGYFKQALIERGVKVAIGGIKRKNALIGFDLSANIPEKIGGNLEDFNTEGEAPF
jgi:P4 family phage/plasmid primase-like protien